jgi:hypothetical protein
MGIGLWRGALWALVVVVLASTLVTIPGARAAAPPNILLGYVYQSGGATAPPVPAGVTVDLISSATHQLYPTKTSSNGGAFSFTSANTAGTLAPGWWGIWVPPQAHVSGVYGCSPCAVLPSNQNPQYYFENLTSLQTQATSANPITVSGVTLLPYNATIWGNVTAGGKPVGGASVELLDPTFNGFVLANNTTVATRTNTTVVGEFSLQVPFGTWVLETIVPGTPNQYAFNQVTVNAATGITVNPTVARYTAWGFVNQAAHPNARVPASGNVTVFDPTNGLVYTSALTSGFYSVGTYPAGFTGVGTQTLDVVIAPVGWQTVTYSLAVSPSNPGVSGKISYSSPIAPPASYQTTLNFSSSFAKVGVATKATLGNDSIFPDLANSSVGQLWGQLGLDWQNSLSFSSANLAKVFDWINSSGPFFAAGQAGLTVNNVGFGQPTNDSFTNASTCSGTCDTTSAATMSFGWTQAYNVTAPLALSLKNYTLAFNFRHPTNDQAFNYTVILPAGYVLNAGTAAPANTKIIAGPTGTFSTFTLVSLPSASASGTASLPIVKYSSANVTANVNVTTTNFAFSKNNVLNSTHGNYTVVLGVGENATFSAVNSTFPTGTNGTMYRWNFGDGHWWNTSQPTVTHTYGAATKFDGTLSVTSSGGLTGSTVFHVYGDALAPTAVISTNQTILKAGATGSYVWVNWSRTLQFNATKSSDSLYANAPVPGVLSVATFNLTAGPTAVQKANYSAGTGALFGSNMTVAFQGAGPYLTAANVNGTAIAFKGWQYNLTLSVWDGAGHSANAYLAILVNDTQKPVPVAAILDEHGHTVTSSGVTEGSNGTAAVYLSAANSSDPHNGSITWYNWTVTNKGNSSVNLTIDQVAVGSSFKLPAKPELWLAPQTKPYAVNLTVTDRASNHAFIVTSLTVAINASTRPVLSVTNLTAPSTVTDGSTYTVWANVSNTIGKNSTAQGVQVRFYLLPPSGTGTGSNIGGSPGSVQFYNYTSNTTVSSTPWNGPVNLPYNKTVRAVISWKPATTGTYDLWVNATAANEFVSSYAGGTNQEHVAVTLNQNPIVGDEEIAGVVAAAVAVIVIIVLLWRRRTTVRTTKTTTKTTTSGKGGLERPKGREEEDDEDE